MLNDMWFFVFKLIIFAFHSIVDEVLILLLVRLNKANSNNNSNEWTH
jgi:hypothetical protein